MKIGIFSDSHDHMENIKKAISIFIEQKVEKIVHCGDIVAPFVKRVMTDLKDKNIEAVGVYGNNDGERNGLIKILGEVLEIKGDFHEVEWNSKKIAITHGTDNRILENLIEAQKYDLILTGHTHQIRKEKRNKTIILNPGETCGYLTGKATCAVMELTENDISLEKIEIVEIK
jgi:uncharacterized protein